MNKKIGIRVEVIIKQKVIMKKEKEEKKSKIK